MTYVWFCLATIIVRKRALVGWLAVVFARSSQLLLLLLLLQPHRQQELVWSARVDSHKHCKCISEAHWGRQHGGGTGKVLAKYAAAAAVSAEIVSSPAKLWRTYKIFQSLLSGSGTETTREEVASA